LSPPDQAPRHFRNCLLLLLKSALITVVLACAAWIAGTATMTSAANANDLFTLDLQPTSPGRVIEDSAGNAYLTWTHRSSGTNTPGSPMFCKIPPGGASCPNPIALSIPGATSSIDEVSGVFPVLGAGSTVYVVAPRYVRDDVVIWTSTNGGESFNAGTLNAKGYSNKTDPSNILLSGSNLLISGSNAGLGFSTTPAAGGSGANFSFASPGSGGVAGSSMGLDGSGNPVEAYWTLSNPYAVEFYRYKGAGSLDEEGNWEGPSLVTNGDESKLVGGGASGLFLVSEDYAAGSNEPNVLDVRKYSGSSFGPPVTLASHTAAGLFEGGAVAESPGGRLAVAWPGTRAADQASVMHLFTSTDGGASFGGATDVAHLSSGYAIGDNAQLALGNGGQGWLTFIDSNGLHVADLNPIAAPAPTPQTPPTYKGKTHTITTSVDGNLLTLKVPGSCLQSAQPFYVGVGKKARHRVAKAVRAKLKVVKVSFFFDGKKLKTLKKKPFRLLIKPGPLTPGKKYLVKSRVTALARKHGHTKRVVRTLKGEVSIC
jgi:hypothetical protein